LHWVNANLLPSPLAVLYTAAKHIATGIFWLSVASSLARALAGYVVALVLGVVLGVVLGKSRISNRLGAPLFNAFRQVAPFAWIPLISAWFGGGEATKVVFIATVAFAPITLNTIEGVQAVAREQVELGRVLELSRWRFLLGIAVPAALPRILTGAQLGLITAWLATIGAEFFLNISPGVTMLLVEGRMLGEMDLVLFGIVIIGLLGFGLSATLHKIEQILLRWRPPRVQRS
jgi:sulfonate transport system permease protein